MFAQPVRHSIVMDRKQGHLPRDIRAVASSLIWIKVNIANPRPTQWLHGHIRQVAGPNVLEANHYYYFFEMLFIITDNNYLNDIHCSATR